MFKYKLYDIKDKDGEVIQANPERVIDKPDLLTIDFKKQVVMLEYSDTTGAHHLEFALTDTEYYDFD